MHGGHTVALRKLRNIEINTCFAYSIAVYKEQYRS